MLLKERTSRKGTHRAWGRIVLLVLVMLLPLLFCFSQLAVFAAPGDGESLGSSQPVPGRIVSLAPSITEILFLLGLADRVAGVTRYCVYPPEARKKPKVGGYYDPSYEAIVALKPDLVIVLPEHEEHRRNLERLGLATLAVDHRDIPGILASIATIGKACGRERAATATVDDLRKRTNAVREKTRGLDRKRVLVSVGRNMGSGRIEDVYITGRTGFYNNLIDLAGGVNAFDGDIAYPMVSEEGILRINPEVIIDMVPDLEEKGLTRDSVLKEWKALKGLDAVRNGRVHVFGQDYTVVPGPRFIRVLEDMARAIHPEADWR